MLCLNLSLCGISCVSVLILTLLRILRDGHVGSTNFWRTVVSKSITKFFFCCSGRLYIDTLILKCILYSVFLRSIYGVGCTELCTINRLQRRYLWPYTNIRLPCHRDTFDGWTEKLTAQNERFTRLLIDQLKR